MPRTHMNSRASVWCLALAGLVACGGPSGPPQGSPEWYYQAAVDNFAIPDYVKTVEQLGEATKGEGELGAKATLWKAVLNAGLARGYHELAQTFVKGVEANEDREAEFRNHIDGYRRRTKVNAVDFAESAGAIQKLIGASTSVAFDFPLPRGNGSVSPLLASVEGGNPATQVPAMEDQTLTRGIFSVIAELTGGGTEYSKLIDEAAAGGIEATPDEMSFGVAQLLLEVGMMFDRAGLNDPKIRGFVVDLAEKWAEPHYENEAFAERVEDFKFDLENERRDMEGKRKIKKTDD